MRILLSVLCLSSLLSQPVLAGQTTPADVQDWAVPAALEILNITEPTWDAHKGEIRKYFTPTGFTRFYQALSEGGISEQVIRNRTSLRAASTCPAQVTKADADLSGPFWVVEMPLVVTYTTGIEVRDDPVKLTLTIRHEEDADNPEYLGIEQWVATPIDASFVHACSGEDKARARIAELEEESEALRVHLEEKTHEIEALRQQLVMPAAEATHTP